MSDHPLATRRRETYARQLSRDDIGNQGRVLLNNFICERMVMENYQAMPSMDELQEPGTPSGPPLQHIKEIGSALRCIADELDQDQRMQRIVNKVPPDAPHQTFLNIANDFFKDGVISWGRIVALFYFGYKMVLKALDRLPLIRAIINWVINFIVDTLAPWIIERGGWEAIVEYFGTPSMQLGAIFMTGVAVSCAVAAYKIWRS